MRKQTKKNYKMLELTILPSDDSITVEPPPAYVGIEGMYQNDKIAKNILKRALATERNAVCLSQLKVVSMKIVEHTWKYGY